MFIHLRNHTHYSLLKALPKVKELISAAKNNKMGYVAITDYSNMYGTIEFFSKCKKEKIKPIIGVEFSLIFNERTFQTILIARTLEGYKNLMRIVSIVNVDNPLNPTLKEETLVTYKNGLTVLSGGVSGDISNLLVINEKDADSRLLFYKEHFGDNFYLEINPQTGMDRGVEMRDKTIEYARKTNTPLVATFNTHYIHDADKAAHKTLYMVHGDLHSSDEYNHLFQKDSFAFVDTDTAKKIFADTPDAISNTVKIAESCELEIPLGDWVFPNIEHKKSYNEDLRDLAYEGLEIRKMELTDIVKTRLEYELKVIADKGYSPYFLVVYDLLRFSRENDILTNIRGSVAGSLVTYLLRITKCDPLAYKLPFERFLNPERPSAPDIDMDYADTRRDEVIDYARRKYGIDNVAQIGTFGTMMARGAVKDVARAMKYPYVVGDRISKLIPMPKQGFPVTIKGALEDIPELKELYDTDREVQIILDMAQKVEGCARHISVHAAGTVISPAPLWEWTPIQKDPKGGKIITQYDMYTIEDAGLLKFDFLGIRNLTILGDAIKIAKENYNIDVDIEEVSLSDAKTFEMLSRGETMGLFQLNGSGMTRFLKELKPNAIFDINAMVALYRPGPLEMIPEYIRRKHDPSLISYLDPRLEQILDQSFGVIVYQDDVMLIAIHLAGYSWLEADKLRKAMGKKIPAEMQAQKEKLLAGFVEHGLSVKKGQKLWELIEPFAAYGFNKCLTGDTKIASAETGEILTIREIYSNNLKPKLLSLGNDGLLQNKKITAVLENGIKNIYELKTRSGRIIRATGNHPLLTFSKWKNLDEIKSGERIAVPRNLSSLIGNVKEKEKAAILGYLISEGNLCHPHGIYFYSTQENEIKDFIKNCNNFENFKYTLDKSKSTTSVYCGQIDQKKGNNLNKWVEKLGLKNKKATEKNVPDCVFKWDKETLSIFIGKLWQGDGCISIKNEQVFYATSSKVLAYDVQHLLLRFSILSTIHEKKFKYRGGIKIGFTVVISHRENLRKFKSTIGMYLIGKKKEDLKKLLTLTENTLDISARGTKNIIPAEVMIHIRRIMLEKNVSVKKISKDTALSERLFSYDKKKTGYQRAVIEKLGKYLKSKEILQIANSDIYWDEVVSIKKSGKEMTYDLTIPPHHNFVANDIIVHNSHAASYGRVAYQTAYMKANFPVAYMTAIMTNESGDVEKIAEIVSECKRMNIKVLPPNVNTSAGGFSIVQEGTENDEFSISNFQFSKNTETNANTDADAISNNTSNEEILFGLYTIKNLGVDISDAIIEERNKNGKYKSFEDFILRVTHKNLNKKSLEALTKCGALDDLVERGEVLANLESILEFHKHVVKDNVMQDSLFGGMETSSFVMKKAPPVSQEQKLSWEKDLLGLFVSGFPLDPWKEKLEARGIDITKVHHDTPDGKEVSLGVIIENIKITITKKGDQMALVKLRDYKGTIEVAVFPETYKKYKSLLIIDVPLVVRGKVSTRNGEKTIAIDEVRNLRQ